MMCSLSEYWSVMRNWQNVGRRNYSIVFSFSFQIVFVFSNDTVLRYINSVWLNYSTADTFMHLLSSAAAGWRVQIVVKETVIQRVCVLTHGSDCSVEAEPPSPGCQRGEWPSLFQTSFQQQCVMCPRMMRSASGSDALSHNQVWSFVFPYFKMGKECVC